MYNSEEYYEDFSEEMEIHDGNLYEINPNVESWVTSNNKDFFFSFKSVDNLPSGLYSVVYNNQQGFGLSKLDFKGENFFHLPSLPHSDIIGDLQRFWDNKQKFLDYNLNPKRGIILYGDPGCHARGTGIIMYNGTVKKIEDIEVGDELMGPDNKKRKVLKLIRGRDRMYEVTTRANENFIVNYNHEFNLLDVENNYEEINIKANELFDVLKTKPNKFVMHKKAVVFENSDYVSMKDPYHMGFTYNKPESPTFIENVFYGDVELVPNDNVTLSDKRIFEYSYNSNYGSQINFRAKENVCFLSRYESEDGKLNFLAGLIDSNTINNAEYVHSNGNLQCILNNEQDAEDIIFIAKSLGYYAEENMRENGSFSVKIYGEITRIPIRINPLYIDEQFVNLNFQFSKIKMREAGEDEFFGFQLDGDHLYLTSDFFVHHNCGKTSLIHLLINEINDRNGISVYMDIPQNWVEIGKMIRKIEKNRPILCIIEDIDLLIDKFGEENFLNFLDGLNSITNVVYVATTNNLNHIPDRIKDRPSRFDKKYEIKKPTESDRLEYFNNILLDKDKKKYDIDKLVKDTNNFTMAHLKETFISLYILDNDYDEVVSRLKKSRITDSKIGFSSGS